MKTIYAGLPIYSSATRQEKNRSGALVPFFCPNTHLPPFQIAESIADASNTFNFSLIKCDGSSIDITNRLYPYISGWTNNSYVTFTSSGANITSAIDTTGDNYALTNNFYVKTGDVIIFNGTLTLNSGDAPEVYLAAGGLIKSNAETLSVGANAKNLISTYTGLVNVYIKTSGATNYSVASVSMTHTYLSATATTDYIYTSYDGTLFQSVLPYGSYCLQIDAGVGETYYSEWFNIVKMTTGNWIKLEFYNSKDLGDICYKDGWKQIHYLPTQLNNPLHEIVEVGEEKDGEYIPEKLVTKFIFKIIAFINKALYRVLIRLPQHDTITITDEVGNVYAPDAGNIEVLSPDWNTFDTAKLTIQFNDGENTAFKWTKNMANMT